MEENMMAVSSIVRYDREREEEKKNIISGKNALFFKRKRCCGNSIGQIVNK